LENISPEGRGLLQVKVDAMTYSSHNLYGEYHWVSRLRENFMSGSYGEGLETGYLAPRQSFTRQTAFQRLAQYLNSEINTLGYPRAALFGFVSLWYRTVFCR
jgi:hypothetical protein